MIIQTGGANGTDMLFETIGRKYRHKIICYSFYGHHTYSENPIILSQQTLNYATVFIKQANINLKRTFPSKNPFINNLLCRDYFIVKDVQMIIGFAEIRYGQVQGGTAWGIECAKNMDCEIYLFDLGDFKWKHYEHDWFVCQRPTITCDRIAGIGTRANEPKIREEIEILLNNKWEFEK